MLNFKPVQLGSSQQPFLGMCTKVAQIMLAPPFKHNFNRQTYNFLTVKDCQSYMPAAGWVANQPYLLNAVIIDSNGNGQKCIVAGTSQTPGPPAWTTGLFTTLVDGGVTWQNLGVLTNIPQINNFGFIEKAWVQDVNSGSEWKEMGISLDLPRDSTSGCPKYISAQTDDNVGNISIRLTPPPAGIYPITMQYQALQVPFTSVGVTWAPIPDRLFYTYSYGVLALAYAYKGDMQRAMWAGGHFVGGLLSYYEGLSETQINQFLRVWSATLGENIAQAKSQQGTALRQV